MFSFYLFIFLHTLHVKNKNSTPHLQLVTEEMSRLNQC